jgi:hypothetical protein
MRDAKRSLSRRANIRFVSVMQMPKTKLLETLRHRRAFFGAFFVGFAVAVAACSASAPQDATVDGQGGPQPGSTATTSANGGDPAGAACKSCIQRSECDTGSVCAQFAGDSFCAKACPTGSECSADTSCTSVSGADGNQVEACIPRSDVCGSPVGPSSDGGTGTIDAGGPVVGSVGTTGGTVSRLYFAVIGDTRPPVINDTSAYPTPIITKIYSDLEALSPRPAFAVSTADYLFSTGNGTQAIPQIDLYLTARSKFSNIVFPTMGNHECTGAVTSNCGTGNTDGLTKSYSAFLSKLLAPIGQTKPNYVIDIKAPDSSWTSKLVFVAGNAWSPSDAVWLDSVLSQPTTYTFIVRHEPKAASNAPGCKASEAIMAKHPYTLAIVGHTHTYGKTGPRQVTIGNGGAPLTGGASYGFGLLQQRADGAIQVDMVDYATGKTDTGFRFALHADGSPAP